jgi:hypothetical protein
MDRAWPRPLSADRIVTELHQAQKDENSALRRLWARASHTKRMMSADRRADIILKTGASHIRQVLVSPGRFGLWLKCLAPGTLARIILARLCDQPFDGCEGDAAIRASYRTARPTLILPKALA